MQRMSVSDYLHTEETTAPRELIWGVLRDAPSPFFSHQRVVTRLTILLDQHVSRKKLGVVCVSPLDVILDERRALVVQPDIVFIRASRTDIIRNQVWGAPDLVVEVASDRTARRDQTVKLGWYRRYGVREYWIVDPRRKRVDVISPTTRILRRRVFAGATPLRSRVLGTLSVSADDLFSQ